MLKINANTKVTAFEDFKRVVKCTLGLQMFKASEYSLRQAAGADDIFTVRFSPATNMTQEALKTAWKYIYKDCLEYGLGDPTYMVGFIPTPCIDNRTLIFRIDFLK